MDCPYVILGFGAGDQVGGPELQIYRWDTQVVSSALAGSVVVSILSSFLCPAFPSRRARQIKLLIFNYISAVTRCNVAAPCVILGTFWGVSVVNRGGYHYVGGKL